jgi:hypothetical protein
VFESHRAHPAHFGIVFLSYINPWKEILCSFLVPELLSALSFFSSIFILLLSGVIPGALAMSVFIMQEPRDLPDITIFLREDEKGVVIENQEN